jgi:hypothetical protein
VTFDAEKLYDLLPAIYRIRDAERVGDSDEVPPLRALLTIIAQQAGVIEQNLNQLYEDQFVETCAPWVLPYLGDLIGIKGLPSAGLEALNPRAEVGHTIGYRRRKGTAAMLEQLAREVTNWPARAVEFFQLLATTQYVNHLRPENQSFISIRGAERLEYLNGPFEHDASGAPDLTHFADVRRIAPRRGRYNIPNVGIFLWRLREFPLTRSPLVSAEKDPKDPQQRFFFNPLGCDLPLFNLPATEDQVTHLAEPINVTDRIRRRVLRADVETARELGVSSSYYGDGLSIFLELPDANISAPPAEVSISDIVICDLTDWANMPTNHQVAIDPVLGRVAFADPQQRPPLGSFYYGFSAHLGGGEYNRLGSFDTRSTEILDAHGRPIVKPVVNAYLPQPPPNVKAKITDALADLNPTGGAVEILNSGRYEENTFKKIDATARRRIVLRAADKCRPALILQTASLEITGSNNDEVILDGLLIVNGSIKITGQLGSVIIRHCTIVPGLALGQDAKPQSPTAPALIIESANARVTIDHSIVGAIQASPDAAVTISDSIVDATDKTNIAYRGLQQSTDYGAPLRITNSTVIGQVRTRILELASNTIFLASFANPADKSVLVAPIIAERRQEGCVRFSYLSPGASVPVRFHCQPESDGSLVRPRFVSTHFNDPGYCQLNAYGPCEIRQGADDEAEMGAFHDLYEPQRETHLRARLEEYLRFGLEAGIFYVT